MVRADELGDLSFARLADDRAAMPAGVMEGADFIVATLDDDDVIGADAHRRIAARLRQLAGGKGVEPVDALGQMRLWSA